MIHPLHQHQTTLLSNQGPVPYRRALPAIRQRSTVMEVMLGLLVGLLTMLLGLPTFLMWAYRHHIGSTWALPLTLFGGLVVSMLVAALSVRRHLPGVFPGLLAGVIGALIILGIVAFYLFF